MNKNDETDEMLSLFLGDAELEETEAEDSNVKVFHASMTPEATHNRKDYPRMDSGFVSIKTGLICIFGSCGIGILLGIVVLVPLGVI